MKETPLPNISKDFVLHGLKSGKRLDGRSAFDYRNINVNFISDLGCCIVTIGDTRVMAQTSCELVEPRPSRPTDGILYLNLELSPMASQGFEAGRMSEQAVELNRLLENCIKDCRCIDTESLCVIAGQKVWQIRLDVHILNHEGALMDCASIAAITALSHFKRPDITLSGEHVQIHYDDKDPVPLSVHHMPVCVTFAFFDQGKVLLVDPTIEEESVMEGQMVLAMNCNSEVCKVHMSGSMLVLKEQLLHCVKIAAVKVDEITSIIKKSLENDAKLRSKSIIRSAGRKNITTNISPPLSINITGCKAGSSIPTLDEKPSYPCTQVDH